MRHISSAQEVIETCLIMNEDLQDRRFDVYNIFGLDNCWAVLREYEPFELLERLEKMFRYDCSY